MLESMPIAHKRALSGAPESQNGSSVNNGNALISPDLSHSCRAIGSLEAANRQLIDLPIVPTYGLLRFWRRALRVVSGPHGERA